MFIGVSGNLPFSGDILETYIPHVALALDGATKKGRSLAGFEIGEIDLILQETATEEKDG
jgi:hypothetical protein